MGGSNSSPRQPISREMASGFERKVISFEAEARMRRADGCYRWFLIQAVPLRDPAEESFGGTVPTRRSKT